MTTESVLSSGLPASALALATSASNQSYTLGLHDRLRSFCDLKDDSGMRDIATLALDMLRESTQALDEAKQNIVSQRARIAQLENLVSTDELTGLTNRRGFTDALERELDRATRTSGRGGLVLMIDLDNFKLINDTYGHAAGDEALRLVAQTLQAGIRRMDVASRMGGDEFVLLFANADVMTAVDRAQQLAMRLNGLTLRWQGQKIPVRASIGMRAYTPGDTPDAVLQSADDNMYAIKARRAQKQEAIPA